MFVYEYKESQSTNLTELLGNTKYTAIELMELYSVSHYLCTHHTHTHRNVNKKCV